MSVRQQGADATETLTTTVTLWKTALRVLGITRVIRAMIRIIPCIMIEKRVKMGGGLPAILLGPLVHLGLVYLLTLG
jgi:hypothetical protein